MKFSSQTLITIAAVAIVLLGLYWFFFTGSNSAPPLSASAPQPASESQFLDLAGELQPVSFDTSILSDPNFNALQDISTAITPEPQGKVDPFAPLSTSGTVSATSSTASAAP